MCDSKIHDVAVTQEHNPMNALIRESLTERYAQQNVGHTIYYLMSVTCF